MGVSVGGSYRSYSAPIKSKQTVVFNQRPDLGTFVINKTISMAITSNISGYRHITATTYAVTSGALPSGVTLSSGGLLSGTIPDVAEGTTYSFRVTATTVDDYGKTVTGEITFVLKVTRLSADTMLSIPLDHTVIADVGELYGNYGGTSWSQFYTRGSGNTLNPTGHYYFVSGVKTLNSDYTSKIDVGTQLTFMKTNDFTFEFFMTIPSTYYTETTNVLLSLNNLFYLNYWSRSYSGQNDGKGWRGINFNTNEVFYTDAPGSSGNFSYTTDRATIDNGGMWHVALVRQNNVMKAYVNGTDGGYAGRSVTTISAMNENRYLTLQGGQGYRNFTISNYAKYTSNFTAPKPFQGYY